MSLPKPLAKVHGSTQKLRIVRPNDPMYAPTEPISVDYLRQITGERPRRSTPPPLPPAARKPRSGAQPTSPSGSMAPLATTVITRRPAGGSLLVSLWAAWLGAAGLFLGTGAVVLRIETRDHAPQVSAAAPARGDVMSAVVPAVEVPRLVLPGGDGTVAERTPPATPAVTPASDTAKAPAVRATTKSKSRTASTTTAQSIAQPPSRSTRSATPSSRGSEIVRSIDFGSEAPSRFGSEAPSSSKVASAPPAETAQAVIKSADAELQAVVRAMR